MMNEEFSSSSSKIANTSTKGVRVFLAEDGPYIRDVIEIQLNSIGHKVTSVASGDQAWDILQTQEFDLYILDRMLPGKNGIELCELIRSRPKLKDRPVIMATALTAPEHIIEGLDAGADDYITKPFDLDVFMARVRRQLRRAGALASRQVGPRLTIGPFALDEVKFKFFLEEQQTSLTKSEYKLLQILMKEQGKVLSREFLIGLIQGEEVHVTTRTIDTHIFGLRKKLGKWGKAIETIRGIGYRLDEKI